MHRPRTLPPAPAPARRLIALYSSDRALFVARPEGVLTRASLVERGPLAGLALEQVALAESREIDQVEWQGRPIPTDLLSARVNAVEKRLPVGNPILQTDDVLLRAIAAATRLAP